MAILVQSNKKPSVTFPSQTGSIVTFNSQYAGLPLKSCVVDFQDGTGIDSLDFTATGKNLFNKSTITMKRFINIDGELGLSDWWSASDYIIVKPNTTYYLSGITNGGSVAKHAFYRVDKTFISAINSTTYQITTPDDCYYLRLSLLSLTPDNVQLEQGDTSTTFEPFGSNKLFSFGKTIQNGSLNVLTGELTNNDTTPPEVIDLGGMNISTLQGENNLFASAGETTASHIKIGG